ncbi:MAG: Bcr/CflA family efflux MFS transporter [Dehalococcoidia bacterium]|nr:Bcr/CflA family efflux MFS transporter [Dehalococcoidia bacterium]
MQGGAAAHAGGRRRRHHQPVVRRGDLPGAGPVHGRGYRRAVLRHGEGRAGALHAGARHERAGAPHQGERAVAEVPDPHAGQHLRAERPGEPPARLRRRRLDGTRGPLHLRAARDVHGPHRVRRRDPRPPAAVRLAGARDVTTPAAAPARAATLSERDRRRAEALPAAALLVALSAVAPLSVDMFLPSMPALRAEFGASEALLQLAVTLFIISFAASQLVYGPASDRLGRRPLLLVGMALFTAGGLLALFAQSAEMLLAGRVLQGLGGGAGPALAQAIVLDVYGRERAARVLSYMAIALPLAPAVAPIIGGGLHEAFGWHAVFATLTALGVLLAVLYRLMLPETNVGRGAGPRGIAGLAADYRTVLSNHTYVGYALVMGLMFAGQLVFISSSSFVLIDELGLNPQMYGLSFGFVALGLMAGATLSSRLTGRVSGGQLVLVGAATAAVSSLLMAAVMWAGGAHVLTLLAPMFVTALGLGLTRPSAMAGALVQFPHIAGLASSVLGFSTMLVATTYNIAYGALVAPSSTALATGVWLAVTAGLLAVLVLRPGRVARNTASVAR